jgi:hypothetical protein
VDNAGESGFFGTGKGEADAAGDWRATGAAGESDAAEDGDALASESAVTDEPGAATTSIGGKGSAVLIGSRDTAGAGVAADCAGASLCDDAAGVGEGVVASVRTAPGGGTCVAGVLSGDAAATDPSRADGGADGRAVGDEVETGEEPGGDIAAGGADEAGGPIGAASEGGTEDSVSGVAVTGCSVPADGAATTGSACSSGSIDCIRTSGG